MDETPPDVQPAEVQVKPGNPRVFPEGMLEITLSVDGELSASEFEIPYTDGLVPTVGDEAQLEAPDATGMMQQVGKARVISIGDDSLGLRVTTRPLPLFTRLRLQAHPVHRCDLLAASPLDTSAVAPGVAFEAIDVAAIGLCGQAMGKYPATPRFHFQLARALDAHQQGESALAHYRRALTMKPDYAVVLLALAGKYLMGEDVEQNTEQGMQFLEQAYDQGLPRAAYTLGRLHDQPQENPAADVRLALAYYTAAALKGDLPSQLRLADMYEAGEVVPADLARALDWREKAAQQGHADSQLRLGFAYARGQGREQDWDRARLWLDRAASQGNSEAQVALGQMYEDGQGQVSADAGKALYWYRQAAEQGSGMGQYHLGRMYALGLGVDKDRDKARHWLELAKAQGIHAAAQLLQPVRPPAPPPAAVARPSDRQLPDTAPRSLKSARRWRVKTQGYIDSACLKALMEELSDLRIRMVGAGEEPDVTLIVTMNNPEYYNSGFGPFRFSGYSVQYRAEAIRAADNIRLFYSHGEEAGDDRSESCVDAVDEITDDLEDMLD